MADETKSAFMEDFIRQFPQFLNYTYNYSYVHPMEARVDYKYVMNRAEWMHQNWSYSIIISALYLLAIYFGQILMRDRKPMELRKALITWNVLLSAFSLLGTCRYAPAFLHTLWTFGFRHTICVTDFYLGVPGFWTELFIVSKVIELGDTLFLVLRKRPITFLHYFHHTTALSGCWYGCELMAACGRCVTAVNYTVHSMMYPYYAIRALGYRVPKRISMMITACQTAQMGFFVVVILAILQIQLSGILITIPDGTNRQEECRLTNVHKALAIFVFLTEFVLFLQFFINTYCSTSHRKQRSSVVSQSNGSIINFSNMTPLNGATGCGDTKSMTIGAHGDKPTVAPWTDNRDSSLNHDNTTTSMPQRGSTRRRYPQHK